MPRKDNAPPPVTMDDVFQYMKAVRDEYNVRIGYVCFPTVDAAFGADFGFTVQVRNMDGRIIREVTCSSCYWPSNKYTSWEAALLDCLHAVNKELGETYLPLIEYLSRTFEQRP